jgi:hypothetical protein
MNEENPAAHKTLIVRPEANQDQLPPQRAEDAPGTVQRIWTGRFHQVNNALSLRARNTLGILFCPMAVKGLAFERVACRSMHCGQVWRVLDFAHHCSERLDLEWQEPFAVFELRND